MLGLPSKTAGAYLLIFVMTFCGYTILWQNAPLTAPDSGSYLRAAQDLSDFRLDQLQERAPAYPVLLWLTGSSLAPSRVLFLVSLFLHLTSIWLLASVLSGAGLQHIPLLLFAAILLLPPYAEAAGMLLSENLAEAMLVSGFFAFLFGYLRNNSILTWLSSIAIAGAALTRPTYQFLPLALILSLLTMQILFGHASVRLRQVVKSSLILLAGFLGIVGGYAFTNYWSFGYFGITPKLGLTLSTKTARVIERLPDDYGPVKDILINARNRDLLTEPTHTGQMYIWSVVPQIAKTTALQPVELSAYMMRLNLLLIKKAPLTFLQEIFWAFGSYWLPGSGELANFNSPYLQLLWGVVHFCLLTAFAVVLITIGGTALFLFSCGSTIRTFTVAFNTKPKMISTHVLTFALANSIVFYTAAVSCVIEVGDPRYRAPTNAFIIFIIFQGGLFWRSMVNLTKNLLSSAVKPPAKVAGYEATP